MGLIRFNANIINIKFVYFWLYTDNWISALDYVKQIFQVFWNEWNIWLRYILLKYIKHNHKIMH